MNNIDNDKMLRQSCFEIQRPADDYTYAKENKSKLLHFVECILPCLTGAHASKFDNDPLVAPLKDHWVHDSDNGIKSKNNLKMYKVNEELANTQKALEDLEEKMQFHYEDELQPAENEEREAKKHVEECKAELSSAKAARKEAFENFKRNFDAQTEEILAVPKRNLRVAQTVFHEKTCELNHKVEKAMAYTEQMNTMESKITEAADAHAKATKEVLEFEFVGGGTIDVHPNRLTGAQIDLRKIPIAILHGIKKYPIENCNDVHQYCNHLSIKMLGNAFLMLQNAGLEENPQYRGAPLHKCIQVGGKVESKAEKIVRFFEVITPANCLLPESVQELKSEIERDRNAKVAAKAAAEEENACSLSKDTSNFMISSKKRKSILEFKAICSPEVKKRRRDRSRHRMNHVAGSYFSPLPCSTFNPLPSSSPWKTGNFDSDFDVKGTFSKKGNA